MSPGFASILPSHSSPGPAVIFGGTGCLGSAHSKPPHRAKPLWWHSPPAGPHSTTPASPSSPRLLTFPLAGNDCHLENIFPPTWFQRGLQTERQELSRDCSALWGEASRRLQGALQPRRSPTHQHCRGTGLPARALAPGTHSCMQSTPSGEVGPSSSRKPQALSVVAGVPRQRCIPVRPVPGGQRLPREHLHRKGLGAAGLRYLRSHSCHGAQRAGETITWQNSATFLIV